LGLGIPIKKTDVEIRTIEHNPIVHFSNKVDLEILNKQTDPLPTRKLKTKIATTIM
jgi:hypothetical protein